MTTAESGRRGIGGADADVGWKAPLGPVSGGPIDAGPMTPGEPLLRWSSRAHSIEDVDRELARMWAIPKLAAARDDGGQERHVAARTSVMNLVVIARRPEIGERAAAEISELTGRHPSRTLIVGAADPDGPSWLDAQVQAHCMLPREEAAEVCAETIYLTAGGESGRHLEAIVAPLLIHDLPVTIWWPGEPPFQMQSTRDLLATADRLVVDASTWSGDGLTRLAQLAELQDETRLAIFDFALVRQSRWREAIASIFDLPDFTPFLGSIRRIAVAYGTHDPTGAPGTTNVVKPVYHVAWIASRLGLSVERQLTPVEAPRAGRARPLRTADGKPPLHRGLQATLRGTGRNEIGIVIRPVVSAMPGGTTLRVELLAERRGSELRADVTAEAETVHARVWLDGIETLDRYFRAPRRTETDLLAEAIESSGRDPVAVDALSSAAELAGIHEQEARGESGRAREGSPSAASLA